MGVLALQNPSFRFFAMLLGKNRCYLHIDGGEASVGDGTADGTSEGDKRVEVDSDSFFGSASL